MTRRHPLTDLEDLRGAADDQRIWRYRRPEGKLS
jgi:hypothetical protein